MDINKAIQIGRETLLKNGIDPREARFLLAFAMNIKKEELLKYRECSDEQYSKYLEIIDKRKSEPFAYIVGHKEFMKLDFKVSNKVLIPREDTEILVQEVIKLSNNINVDDEIKILDMCTGSGCIAISLAKYINNAKVTAIDINDEALMVAKENAERNNVEIKFIQSNLFENLSENNKFDIIVSNPPYIQSNVIETLQDDVKREPILALDGGEDGLYFYNEIIKNAYKFLNENGFLAFEIGFDQALEVSNIMKQYEYTQIKIVKDLSNNDRVVIGKI